MHAEIMENAPSIRLDLTIEEALALYWGIHPDTVEAYPLPDERKALYSELALDIEAVVFEALELAEIDPDEEIEQETGEVVPVDLSEMFDPEEINAINRACLMRAFGVVE